MAYNLANSSRPTMPDPDWQNLFRPIDVSASPAVPEPSQPPAAPPPQPIPSAFDRAASLTTSLAKFAASGFRTVSYEVYQARFAHCLPCEQYDLGLCRQCGCYLDAKVRMPHEECPLDKWPASS